MKADEVKQNSLRDLWPGCAVTGSGDTWMVDRPGEFPLSTLLKVAEILECTPDQLHCELDAYDPGGCPTCSGSIERELNLWVKR